VGRDAARPAGRRARPRGDEGRAAARRDERGGALDPVRGPAIRRALIVGAAGAFGLALALALWSTCIEPASLRVTTTTLALPRWPRALDGLRVAVLADLHVGSPWNGVDNLARVIERTKKAGADVILLTGDYVVTDVVGGTFVPPETIADALRALHPPLGVYAVLGNHDCWLDAPRVRTAFERVGIPVLDDTAREIDPSRRLWLAGIGDFWEERHDVRAALADVPDDAVVLVFTHNPDVFPNVPDRVALTIAGHTHGGQVALPFVGRPIVPSKYGERYAIGHVVEDRRHLFVSPGIGTSLVPVRFRVPPEISVLTLRSADDARAAR
jgi:hypothetical protein